MILQTKFNLPAEWSKQDAILLCWPHQSMDWEPILSEVEPEFDQIAYQISQYQKLIIIAYDQDHQHAIHQRLVNINARMDAIDWLLHPNNDTWCRDFGPITVNNDDQVIALDFQFNGWGEKYAYQSDNEIPQQLLQHRLIHCPLQTIPFVLEGGSIDSNGEGTVLTTEQCLLSNKRNPGLNKQQIEEQLSKSLGCSRILWLSSGHLEGDDTDSHIDNLARFCDPNTIAYASCDDPSDSHYQDLKAMEDELKQFRTANGEAYQLIALPIPQAIYHDGDRLPASYVNFLITNQQVLMPVYNAPEDTVNLKALQSIFKDREVIGVSCRSIIKQSGSVHCLTMQLPEHTIN